MAQDFVFFFAFVSGLIEGDEIDMCFAVGQPALLAVELVLL